MFAICKVKILTKISFRHKYPNVLADVLISCLFYQQMRDFEVKTVFLKVIVLTQYERRKSGQIKLLSR